MKQIIKDVLEDMSSSQVNLGSSAARKMVSTLISTALESKGCYTEYDDSEIEEQNARATWVCSICGENTFDVEYDYLGSGTNHLGCELKSQEEIDEYVEDIDEQAYAQGRGSSKDRRKGDRREKNYSQKKHEDKVFGGDTGIDADFIIPAGEEVDGMYFDDEVKEWEEAVGYVEPDNDTDTELRDKVFEEQKQEFYRNDDNDDIPEGLKRAKELAQEGLKEGLQKQAYMEMTSDGLPEGGDAQAVLESHKLADEIVDNQKGKWIYESPDGGKTVFRRPFSDYDPKNKEEIDWETKEPTGRKFTEYNNGNWKSETPYYDAAHNINNEEGHEE
jgi:hypothetical protein